MNPAARPWIPSLMAVLLLPAGAAAQEDAEAWLRSCARQAEKPARALHCDVRLATTQLAAGGLAIAAEPNGGIVVRGGGAGDVQVSARVQAQAESEARARAIADQVQVHTSGGRVWAEGPRTADRENWSVTYVVTVPQRANLELTSLNGPVAVHDVTGDIRVSTTNGPLTLERLAGSVHARTANGPLRVVLAGDRWDGAGIDAETRNGPVDLAIPDGYSAALETGTVNGPFSSAVPLTVTSFGGRERRFQTTLGSGGPPVRVLTINGPVSLTRR